jgi:hypothetical protein
MIQPQSHTIGLISTVRNDFMRGKTMNTSAAIFAGMLSIAAAIYMSGGLRLSDLNSAHAADADEETSGKGVWVFRGHGAQLVLWKMNSKSGELYACSHSSGQCTKMTAN